MRIRNRLLSAPAPILHISGLVKVLEKRSTLINAPNRSLSRCMNVVIRILREKGRGVSSPAESPTAADVQT